MMEAEVKVMCQQAKGQHQRLSVTPKAGRVWNRFCHSLGGKLDPDFWSPGR